MSQDNYEYDSYPQFDPFIDEITELSSLEKAEDRYYEAAHKIFGDTLDKELLSWGADMPSSKSEYVMESEPVGNKITDKFMQALRSTKTTAKSIFNKAYNAFKKGLENMRKFWNSERKDKKELIAAGCRLAFETVKDEAKKIGGSIVRQATKAKDSIKSAANKVVEAPGKFRDMVKNKYQKSKNYGIKRDY